jgi:hypothetical protein
LSSERKIGKEDVRFKVEEETAVDEKGGVVLSTASIQFTLISAPPTTFSSLAVGYMLVGSMRVLRSKKVKKK